MSRLTLLLTLAFAATPALGQTGVSDDRVSLPEGPGSLEGIGENADVSATSGLMTHRVEVMVPEGYPGLVPDLSLSYSSGGGGSVVGMGWGMTIPAIERLTLRGLPEYDADDEMSVNGSEQLVRLPGTNPPTYRARFEKSFVRYRWYGAADGKKGYWTAEYPDGRVGYFGADAAGTISDAAHVGGTKGTFRWHLVAMTDRYGHAILWTYSKFGSVTLPLKVAWAHVGGIARYEVTFTYEDRPDALSDCKPGFEERLTKRLTRIHVKTGGVLLRRYELGYEDTTASGGITRLASVSTVGALGGVYPIQHTFQYSKGLGVDCEGSGCLQPYVSKFGSKLGVDLSQGHTTLIDLNGDGLPDLVDSTQTTGHRLFLNQLKDGAHSFVQKESAVGTGSSHDLASKAVEVLDVDGDGFVDLMNVTTGQVLINKGQGDWEPTVKSLWSSGGGGLPSDFEPAAGELKSIRFMDYNGDKRIDVIRSVGTGSDNTTTIFRSQGLGSFALEKGDVDDIGEGFESGTLELNDMNGDGLLDPVQILNDVVRYRLSYGWGRFGPWEQISGFDFTDLEKVEAELEDLNGDAMADIVLVAGNTVTYWINRNGATFDAPRVVTSADVEGDIPTKTETTVLFADMNGTGSSDVVWIDVSGQITFLELFPVRPNLISRIENGIGKVIELTYGASVVHRAADAAPWAHPLPHPMTVVDEMREWDELSGVVQTTQYDYHDGYYDGVEKTFRGYARAETILPGDEHQADGGLAWLYDVGETDPYRAGLLVREDVLSDGALLMRTTSTWADCPLSGVPDDGLFFDVRHVCKTADEVEHREGLSDASAWITTRKVYVYDGYGNVSLESDLGVVAGCDACATPGYTGTPCGPQCVGDERYTETVRAKPEDNADAWILDRPVRERVYGVAGDDGKPATSTYSEKLTYYDGAAFVGLEQGKLTEGKAVRVTERVDATGATITSRRVKLDAHGNVVEAIDPTGSVAVTDNGRRRWTMDTQGLRVVSAEVLFASDDGPYIVHRDYGWDPLWDAPTEASLWRVVGGLVEPGKLNYGYDEFGRVASISRPGAGAGAPSELFSYELGAEVTRVLTQRRSVAGAAPDMASVSCYDGHGREVQRRDRVSADAWVVSGFAVFNARGAERYRYDAYDSPTGACDAEPLAGVTYTTYALDGLGRRVARYQPELAPGVVPTGRTVFGPLTEATWDAEDTRQDGPHEGTPEVRRMNGLGQVIAVERRLTKDGAPLVHRMLYDELGHVAGVIDPSGIETTEVRDFIGRIALTEDPDRGVTTYEHDDRGNITRQVDGAGVVVRRAYDGGGRLVAEWREDAPEATKTTWTWDIPPADCPVSTCTHTAGRKAAVTYALGDGTFGEDRFGYDAEGRVVWQSRTVHGMMFDRLTTRDHMGRTIEELYPSGLVVKRSFDGKDRISGVPGYIASVTYQPTGERAHVALQNGVATDYGYDVLERLTSLTAAGSSGPPVLAYGYARDLVGNVLAIADERADDGQPMGGAAFTYDSLYRLTGAVLDPDRPAFTETLTTAYDASDRITSATSSLGAKSAAHVGAYTYGDGRAVTKAGGLAMSYDKAGRMTSRSGATYQWDHLDRLTSIASGGQEVARHGYGPEADRILKVESGATTLTIWPDFEVRGWSAVVGISGGSGRDVRVEQPSFAAKILSDLAPAGGADAALVPIPDGSIGAGDAWLAHAASTGALTVADPAAPVSSVNALLEASNARLLGGVADKVTFEHHDALGSTVAVTDASGKLVTRAEVYPYGAERYTSGDVHERAFTGKERDASGLVYFGARYLDPVLGRWLSADPAFRIPDASHVGRITEATGGYSYVADNPLRFVDPDGAWAWVDAIINYFKTKDVAPAVGVVQRYDDHHVILNPDIEGERTGLVAYGADAKEAMAAQEGPEQHLDLNGDEGGGEFLEGMVREEVTRPKPPMPSLTVVSKDMMGKMRPGYGAKLARDKKAASMRKSVDRMKSKQLKVTVFDAKKHDQEKKLKAHVDAHMKLDLRKKE